VPPAHLPRHLLFRTLAYRLQADRFGDLDSESEHLLDRSESPDRAVAGLVRGIAELRPGTVLGREKCRDYLTAVYPKLIAENDSIQQIK
jgi:hypothetical protein